MAGNEIGITHASAWLQVIPALPTTTDVNVVYPQHHPVSGMLIAVIGAVVAAVVVFFVTIQIKSQFRKKVPHFVAIENLDQIPPTNRLKETTL